MSTAQQSPRTPASAPAAAAIADPAPLGLAGFAMTTLVLSSFNAGFLDKSASAVVLPLALFYGGLVQLLAGMWEFRRGNTFGATAFASFGAFWLAYYALVKSALPSMTASSAANTGNAVGLFLLVWGVFTLYMAVAALRVSLAVLSVFVTLTITFVVLAIGSFAANDSVTKAGGWIGLITGLLAWYTSFAGVTASTFGRPILPTWPAE
jgi:succinate-acetate transporter protein